MSTDREREALALLRDPNAVHVNLLNGQIARPSPEQIVHIYGAETLARAAGWMPRPEPRSDLEAEMAERLWVKLPPHEPPISVAEVQYALRAALGTGDKTGPEVHDGR